MSEQKIVFIIPGFGHLPSQKGYTHLKKVLKNEGYKVIPIRIPWKASTITDNSEYFLKSFQKKLSYYDVVSKDVYILGFSYGALIAFLAATKISVRGLILCSLSPFFKEDLPKKLPLNFSDLQMRRYECFSELHAGKLAQKIKAKEVYILYGERESKTVINRSKKTFRIIASKKKYLFTVKQTDHSISDKKYINAIQFACNFL